MFSIRTPSFDFNIDSLSLFNTTLLVFQSRSSQKSHNKEGHVPLNTVYCCQQLNPSTSVFRHHNSAHHLSPLSSVHCPLIDIPAVVCELIQQLTRDECHANQLQKVVVGNSRSSGQGMTPEGEYWWGLIKLL